MSFFRPKKRKVFPDNIKVENATILGDVNIGEGSKVVDGVMLSGGKITIGRYTSVNGPNTDIYARINEVTIGNFCSIARNVSIQEFNHHSEKITSYFVFHNIFKKNGEKDYISKGPVSIGHDVWIGAHSVILSNVKIGNGAIIAANSVVTADVPPFAIVGGVPAKVLKYRFSAEIIDRLQEIEWWNWDIEKIKRNEKVFSESLSEELFTHIID